MKIKEKLMEDFKEDENMYKFIEFGQLVTIMRMVSRYVYQFDDEELENRLDDFMDYCEVRANELGNKEYNGKD